MKHNVHIKEYARTRYGSNESSPFFQMFCPFCLFLLLEKGPEVHEERDMQESFKRSQLAFLSPRVIGLRRHAGNVKKERREEGGEIEKGMERWNKE